MLKVTLLLMLAAVYACAEDHHHRGHNYMLSDDFIDEINREATTWRAGRNFHPRTSANYIKVRVDKFTLCGIHLIVMFCLEIFTCSIGRWSDTAATVQPNR